MKRNPILTSVCLVVLLLVASLSRAQDAAKKETSPSLKSVSCPPECGFMCRSHDEKELIEIVKAHALTAHGKALSDEQVKSFMQPAPTGPSAPKKP